MEAGEVHTRWRRAALSRLYLELAGLSFAVHRGHTPQEYARHLWSRGAVERVGSARPSPSEYIRQEAEAISVLWPGLELSLEDGDGSARLVFTRGCLGAGWGRPWAVAGRLGLGKEQVCAYCQEAFRVWGEQLGLDISLCPQDSGTCSLTVTPG